MEYITTTANRQYFMRYDGDGDDGDGDGDGVDDNGGGSMMAD